VAEARAELGYAARPARDDEVEFAWIMHGGIFYYGVRDLIYESCVSADKRTVIADSVEALLAGLALKFARADGPPGQEGTEPQTGVVPRAG
jgi:hypothetical protein